MDLKEINSVNDLLEANKEPGYLEKMDELIGEAVKAEGLSAAMVVAVNILAKIESVHDMVVEEAIEEKDIDQVLAWTNDGQKINTAISILKTVEL